MNRDNLFVRNYIDSFDKKYLNNLSNMLNLSNLNKWSYKKTQNLYSHKCEQEFLYYRFALLKEWIKNYETYTRDYLETLEKYINVLGLQNFLNAYEKKYLMTLKSYLFTISRNIKTLIVDFPINKNEQVYFHYDKVNLNYLTGNKKILLKNIFDMYLSNQRFVFCGHLEIISIDLNSILEILFKDKEILVKTKNFTYKIQSMDLRIIEISIKRLFKIIKLEKKWEEN